MKWIIPFSLGAIAEVYCALRQMHNPDRFNTERAAGPMHRLALPQGNLGAGCRRVGAGNRTSQPALICFLRRRKWAVTFEMNVGRAEGPRPGLIRTQQMDLSLYQARKAKMAANRSQPGRAIGPNVLRTCPEPSAINSTLQFHRNAEKRQCHEDQKDCS